MPKAKSRKRPELPMPKKMQWARTKEGETEGKELVEIRDASDTESGPGGMEDEFPDEFDEDIWTTRPPQTPTLWPSGWQEEGEEAATTPKAIEEDAEFSPPAGPDVDGAEHVRLGVWKDEIPIGLQAPITPDFADL